MDSITITASNQKRSTKNQRIAILKDHEHDRFHFIVLKQSVTRKKQLQNIETQKRKKLELKIASLLPEKANYHTESSS